jgi:hypothetical protein
VVASAPPQDLGASQPHVFLGDVAFGFWGGMAGVSDEQVRSFFDRAARTPEEVFPVRFRVSGAFVVRGVEVVVPGWARLPRA